MAPTGFMLTRVLRRLLVGQGEALAASRRAVQSQVSIGQHSTIRPLMETLTHGISYTDLMHCGRPRVIATAIIQSTGGVALVDPGPTSCLKTLRTALTGAGITIADVRTLLLTHIHLDHAGAAGSLVAENPEITIYVHERGAPHMIDPAKLLASASRLYGDAMDSLWGPFLPVPKANVRVLSGGERIEVSDRTLEVMYTPGHASHHVSFFDRESSVAFVGDVAGVRTGQALFVMPPTPPPDIDVEVWNDSIDVVRKWQASTLLITHYGAHEDTAAHLDAIGTHLAAMKEMSRECIEAGGSDDDQLNRFVGKMRMYLKRHIPAEEVGLYGTAAPIDQCWLGLARYWRKRGLTAS